MSFSVSIFFFFNDTATTEIYTLSLHDALPIYRHYPRRSRRTDRRSSQVGNKEAETPSVTQAVREVVIGTRGSKLALWQAEWGYARLRELEPALAVSLKRIKTTGDKILDKIGRAHV